MVCLGDRHREQFRRFNFSLSRTSRLCCFFVFCLRVVFCSNESQIATHCHRLFSWRAKQNPIDGTIPRWRDESNPIPISKTPQPRQILTFVKLTKNHSRTHLVYTQPTGFHTLLKKLVFSNERRAYDSIKAADLHLAAVVRVQKKNYYFDVGFFGRPVLWHPLIRGRCASSTFVFLWPCPVKQATLSPFSIPLTGNGHELPCNRRRDFDL